MESCQVTTSTITLIEAVSRQALSTGWCRETLRRHVESWLENMEWLHDEEGNASEPRGLAGALGDSSRQCELDALWETALARRQVEGTI